MTKEKGIKPRGKMYRITTPTKAKYSPIGNPNIEICSWCPDAEAKMPPEQVHMIFNLPGLEEFPIILRYLSPDTLGFLIEELIRYRRDVWPNSELITGEKNKEE